MKIIRILAIMIVLSQGLFSQNTWIWNNRTHPELEWKTLETEHFNIHYHQGIENIARKSGIIAEQIYQPVLDQLQLKKIGRTDIVLSAEDEIMNGFAMPTGQIFIWVSQNDVAGHFGGSEKWLKMVLTHEFQHVAQMRAQHTWAGIWSDAGVPSWWMEGMAEYMTEVWRVGRSDARMKEHTYKNTMEHLNAHDDGYAKVLYLAWKYGDSTLVKIANHRLYLDKENRRYPYWYYFKTAFKEATGQSVKAFEEEWRRVMNTYYYAYKAQKEGVDEVGKPYPTKSFAMMYSGSISPDSSKLAIIGRRTKSMLDWGLYTVELDSSSETKEIHHGRFSGMPAWSPDASQIVLSEYHRGSHGSLIHDLRLVDVKSGRKEWLTKDFRALHPEFATDGKGLYFVAHPGETTQLYYLDMTTRKRVQLTQFEGDIQLQRPVVSPDGKKIAFMIQDDIGNVDIALIDRDGSNFKKLTSDPEEDMMPVWTSAGDAIVYTSFRNSTPNLYRIDIDDQTITQMTDVAEGITSLQRIPGSDMILSATLNDVDTVRVMSVDAHRVARQFPLNIRNRFAAWRTKAPDVPIPSINYDTTLAFEGPHDYRAIQSFRTLAWLVWPDTPGLFGLYAMTDALGKHLVQFGGLMNWQGGFEGGFFSYANFRYLPVISIYGAKNFTFNLRTFQNETRFEALNGGGIAAVVPMNLGNSLSSNHQIIAHLRMINRRMLQLDESQGYWVTDPDVPSTDETNLSLTYAWKSQRPHREWVFLPNNGMGALGHVEWALPKIWGENDYTKYWVEAFLNLKIPKLPVVLYNRLKWEKHEGEILPQDSIGFSSRDPIYLTPGSLVNLISSGIMDAAETYKLRGQLDDYPAAELIYNVTEIRFPLLKKIPVNVFGLTINQFTGALFHDYGYLPELDKQLSTMGGELRFNVSISHLPIVVLSYGFGGEYDFWQQALEDSENTDFSSRAYFRMAMVNPF